MRICPRCGHEDPVYWFPAAYHQEFSYAHTSALETHEPELVAAVMAVRRGEMIRRGPYLYWRSRTSDTIRRVWVEDYLRVRKKGSWREKSRLYRQLKLEASLWP